MTIGELAAAFQRQGATGDAGKPLHENGATTPRGRGYVFDPGIIRAVDVAIALGRPLLVAGEPGCGKTELGHAVARRLGIETLHLFTVKSTTDATELFYAYDAIRRFQDAQPGMGGAGKDVGDYVEYQALGRAILDAHPRAAVAHLLRGERNAKARLKEDGSEVSPQRSVVVIDEIDKASSDFANDLLHEIEGLRFRVKEFPATPREPDTPAGHTIPAPLRPIVIVTSNEERQLPDAFLRRCVFLEIAFPDAGRLSNIVDIGLSERLRRMLGDEAASTPALSAQRKRELIEFFEAFRANGPTKRPGVAELLDGAALMAVSSSASLADIAPAMVKTRADLALAPLSVVRQQRQEQQQ